MLEKDAAMATEQTPLIQTRPVAPPRPRYPHHTLRRICTALLTFACGVALAFFLVTVAIPQNDSQEAYSVTSVYRGLSNHWLQSYKIPYHELQRYMIITPRPSLLRQWSKYYTSGPHLAGKNYSQAEWTRDKWEEFGVASTIVPYDIYINYPLGHSLSLLESKNGSNHLKFKAKLEEDVLEKDETTGLADRIPTFHGYSASGNVTGQYVWVNYGTFQDYDDLVKAGIDLKGKIALAKYGGIFRGLKIKRAQELGMIGCLIYSDTGDDGEITEENGYKPYPEGPARQPSSVQRGSVQFLSIGPGDPTTPGYPSKPGAPRVSPDDYLPSIPSLPLSYQDALPLLKALNGHGPNVTSFNKFWQRGNGLRNKGVDYNIGPSPPEITINFVNEQEYVTTPLWNVIGVINGTLSDEVVVLGNHRDAWIAGGAADPNSGSAALVEVVRAFGLAVKNGWKPLRTIVFASWDGEEYGLIGSTEWVEEYLPWLSKSAVAYLNVDVGASGSTFTAAGAPLLHKALQEVTEIVPSPNQTIPGQKVSDLWNQKIRTIGSGSDFTAFQDFAGIPCVDMGFTAGSSGSSSPNEADSIYHYHSNYDSFYWMDNFGDPGWQYHLAAVRLWSLLAVKISENPVLPFSASKYSDDLILYVDEKKALVAKMNSTIRDNYQFHLVDRALREFKNTATILDIEAAQLRVEAREARKLPWYKFWKKLQIYLRVKKINLKYKYIERAFLFREGLDGRPWFKHTVYAPGLWTGYAGATFPGLVESIEAKDVGNFYRWQHILAEQIFDEISRLSR